MSIEPDEAYLEINTRDLIASLNRLLMTNVSHTNPQIVTTGSLNLLDKVDYFDNNGISTKYNNFFFRENMDLEDDNDIHSNGVIYYY